MLVNVVVELVVVVRLSEEEHATVFVVVKVELVVDVVYGKAGESVAAGAAADVTAAVEEEGMTGATAMSVGEDDGGRLVSVMRVKTGAGREEVSED